jgi:hypothetical protein
MEPNRESRNRPPSAQVIDFDKAAKTIHWRQDSLSTKDAETTWISIFLKIKFRWGPVAHSWNSSYSGGRDQEDYGLKPSRANRLNLKKPFTKIGLVEWLKVKVLGSNPSTEKKIQFVFHTKYKI